jgi:hypothetical protein
MRTQTILAGLVACSGVAACSIDSMSPPSSVGSLSANRVTGGEFVNYEFRAGTAASPRIAMAANGDRIEIVVTRPSTFTLHPKSVSGSGTFTHKTPDGTVRGSGTWTATQLLSFNSYGSSPGLPSNFEGGLALVRVHLSPAAGGPGLDAVLEVNCLIGSAPPAAQEGIRLAVESGPNFNQVVEGGTLFIRL